MNKHIPQSVSRVSRAARGFTLVEVMVCMFLLGLVFVGGMTFFVHSARHVQDGTEHITFIDRARIAEQEITSIIQYARAVAIPSGAATSLDIVQPDLTRSRLYYVDGGDAVDQVMMYDPDLDATGDERVVSTHVSGIPGIPMFQVFPGTNNTTQVAIYVGLRPPEEGSRSPIRKSYTGANVYLTASPRNVVDYIRR